MAVLLLALLACAPGPAPGPTGLDLIAADDLREVVTVLASDAFAGRDTLGPGGDRAAAWIAERLTALGLQPLPGHDDLKVPYTLYARGPSPADLDVTWLRADAEDPLVPGGDAYAFPFSASGELEAPVVFAGYGITAPEVGYDDYAGLDVRGKVVLVLRHHPREGDREAPLQEGTAHAHFTSKAQNAQKHGAIGMIVVTDPTHDAADDLRMSPRLSIDPPPPVEPAGEGPDPSPPPRARDTLLAVQVSQAAAERLVAGAGYTLASLQEAVDGGTPPARLGLGDVAARLRLSPGEDRVHVDHNVVAMWPGTDPEAGVVVIGAHYDHVGAFSGEGDTVYNGADDNASGVAGVLAVAEAFASLPPKERSVVFAFFSGEEKGLLGSRALVRDRVIEPAGVHLMVNLDMIGRNPDRPLQVIGDGYATGLTELVVAAAGDLPVAPQGLRYSASSDHHSFFREDVPALHPFSGLHDDYHQVTDHADLLDYERVEAVARMTFRIADRVASGAVTPIFIHHVDWLGVSIVPDGERAEITTVAAGSRAARAGVQPGDAIAPCHDGPLGPPAIVGRALREVEPGTTMQLCLQRGDEQVQAEVTRAPTGFLGIIPSEPSDEVRRRFGLGPEEGIRVVQLVKDGAASQAGLEREDVIYRIAGESLGLGELRSRMARIGAGEEVVVAVIRGGERLELPLVLAEFPR